MISVNEAYNILPDFIKKNVKKVFKWSNESYLFVAPESDDDGSDPFYIVNERGVLQISPFEDINTFCKALNNPVEFRRK